MGMTGQDYKIKGRQYTFGGRGGVVMTKLIKVRESRKMLREIVEVFLNELILFHLEIKRP